MQAFGTQRTTRHRLCGMEVILGQNRDFQTMWITEPIR